MKNNSHVLYHRNCADGFGAAWSAYKNLGEKGVRYHPCAYGEPPPDMEPGSRVYILDFSFPRNIMLELSQQREVVLLDHHETAEQDIGDLAGCHFDTSHSGAVLAWNWFHEDSKIPKILRYVEDRDLWKWELPGSREVSAALDSHPKDFEVWNQLDVGELAWEGRAILRHNRMQVERIIQDCHWRDMGDRRVPVVNTPILASEACEALLKKFPNAPFAAAYHNRGERQKWSLRSRGNFDVSELARLLGGGGHPAAAGYLEEA